jgi:hypothetical protein
MIAESFSTDDSEILIDSSTVYENAQCGRVPCRRHPLNNRVKPVGGRTKQKQRRRQACKLSGEIHKQISFEEVNRAFHLRV